jgi:hypothetical protein
MKTILLLLFAVVASVVANTESLFHWPPFTPLQQLPLLVGADSDSILELTINEEHRFIVDVPATKGVIRYLHLNGFQAQDHRYNARVSWSALDAIDVATWNLVQFEGETYALFEAVRLYDDDYYETVGYSKETSVVEVEVVVLVEELVLGVIPKSLVGVAALTGGCVVLGLMLSRYVYALLVQ